MRWHITVVGPRVLFCDVKLPLGRTWHRATGEATGWFTLCGRSFSGPVCWNEVRLTTVKTTGPRCQKCWLEAPVD